MRTKLPVDSFAYLADFVYVKVREVWPDAVILDHRADVRFCRATAFPSFGYGFDVFRSEAEVEQLLSGDCCPPPPSVNISVESEGRLGRTVINLRGSVEVVRHLAQQPLWSSS